MKSIKKINWSLWRRRVALPVAMVVVFVTTYSLILPAITMERESFCGMEEHTHSDECYTVETVYTCGLEEGEEHTHTEECISETRTLTCGLEEHVHTEECYVDPNAPAEEETDAADDADAAAPAEEDAAVSEDDAAVSEDEAAADAESEEDVPAVDAESEEDVPAADAESEEDVPAADAESEEDVPAADAGSEEDVPAADDASADDAASDETGAPEAGSSFFEVKVDGEPEAAAPVPADVTFEQELDPEHPDRKVTVIVDCTAAAGIPADAVLEVKEFFDTDAEYDGFFAVAEEELCKNGEEIFHARFFDFTIRDAAGNELALQAPVKVKVVSDALTDQLVHAVSLDAEQPAEVELTAKDNTVRFDADGFTAFAVVQLKDEELPAEEEPAAVPVPDFEMSETEFMEEGEVFFMPEEEPEEEPEPLVGADVTLKKVLVSDGQTVTITVDCKAEAGVPADAQLQVREIRQTEEAYDGYLNDAKDAIDLEKKQITFVRFFDITILDANGNEIQPTAAVDVKIVMSDAAQADEENAPQVLHYGDENTEIVDSVTEGDTVSFEANGFSVYGIVGTEIVEQLVVTDSGKTLKVTVEVADMNDIARLESLRVTELDSTNPAYQTAYDAVVAAKAAADDNFDENRLGFFAADIELLDSEGNSFEPEGSVNVKFELINLPADEDTLVSTMEVQHLKDNNGDIEVQTVAVADDVTSVNDVVTTDFTVDSFSTFTLTWTDEGFDVVDLDDASQVLNIQVNDETYATVNVHYIGSNGHYINSPLTASLSSTSPVTLETLLNQEIENFTYKGIYYNAYNGDEITTIAVSREGGSSQSYVSQGTTQNNGRPTNGWTPSQTGVTYYGDVNGSKQQIYYRYVGRNWRFMTHATEGGNNYRYANGTVYTLESTSSYDFTLSLTNNETEVAVLNTSQTQATWSDAADIYVVYDYLGGETKAATVHFGYLDDDGNFVEMGGTISIDSSEASISLDAHFHGYTYVSSYYGTEVMNNPVDDGVEIQKLLHFDEEDTKWKYTTKSDSNPERKDLAHGSHIYSIYVEQTTSNPSGADNPNVLKPLAEKTVTDNENGTYDIQLDVMGKTKTETDSQGANVIIVLDRTYSMASGLGSTTRWEAAQEAVEALVTALNTNTNDIDLAIAPFSNTATDKKFNDSYWTSTGSDMIDYVNGLSHKGVSEPHGTNWQAGLSQASNILATADEDPTYVIFVTDGEPNYVTDYTAPNGRRYTNESVTTTYAYNAGLAAAQSLVNTDNPPYFYGVFCGNDDGAELLGNLVSAVGGVKNINGTDENTLKTEFQGIAHYIVNNLGNTNVSISDGITSLASSQAEVSGAVGNYRYSIGYVLTAAEGGGYTYTDIDGVVHTIQADQEGIETGSDGSTKIFFEEWAGHLAPAAEIEVSESGVTYVEWDLSEEGSLPSNIVYRLSFTVWPSQDAEDILADINNKVVRNADGTYVEYSTEDDAYNALDPEIKKQIYKNVSGKYVLATNTDFTVTYDYKGTTYTDEGDTLQRGAIPLEDTKISVQKLWSNMLDSRDITQDYNNIYLEVIRDGQPYYEVTLNQDNNWKQDNIYISCGIIVDGEVITGDEGHDFTLIESGGSAHYYDLKTEVYRPMEIDGDVVILKKVGSEDEADYTIEGGYYAVLNDGGSILIGTNERRSWLNLTKEVTTKAESSNLPKDDLFEYTITLTIPEDIVATNPDVERYILFQTRDTNNNNAVITTDQITTTAQTYNNTYLAAESGREFTLSIKKGWNVRFVNLPAGTTYSIKETSMKEYYEFRSVEGIARINSGENGSGVWSNIPSYTPVINDKTITGTITQANASFDVSYTNEFVTAEVILIKMNQNATSEDASSDNLGNLNPNKILSGAIFTLNRKATEDGVYEVYDTGITIGDAGYIIMNLPKGYYQLVETTSPAGYLILNGPWEFIVGEHGNVYAESQPDLMLNRSSDNNSSDVENRTLLIINHPGSALPMTGASGTLPYTLGGAVLIIASALMYGFRMRRRERRLR